MPIAHVNGVDLAYEEYGSGFPLIWCHEFAGSMESWDPQVHYFARRYRVIVYNARGYPPSGVPADPKAYSQDMAVEDIYGLLRHLGIEQAHVGGLSMGGSATLHFGLRHPEMARSLIIAAAGSGSTNPEEFRATSLAFADRLEREGAAAFADYGNGATRQQLKRKDPRGYDEFLRLLKAHSPAGSAGTMRGVQAGRPPIFVWEKEMQALRVPSLILVGDEDEPCIEPSLFMKQHIPSSGLGMFPQSGHCINLEEPDLYNRLVAEFLDAVEAGKWDSKEQGT
ncbi:MAG TPA: alpha/beta hydrolase [Dehalococcoidia bacterium]|nr:alpha/beta hydrolase [Dehalococcoidia bacterium]